jgi:hypothetical protein
MSDIRVNDLAVLSPSALDDTYNTIVFTSDGDTNQVVFEDAVAQANANNGCVCLQEATLVIPTAYVLQLNSTPLTIVSAQGAGTVIEVISASASVDFNSAAYATNTALHLSLGGDAILGQIGTNFLASTVTKMTSSFTMQSSTAGQTQTIENADLIVTNSVGDPTTGDSDITVRVLYRVITL